MPPFPLLLLWRLSAVTVCCRGDLWEEKVGALLQRAAAWLHLTHAVTQSSLNCAHTPIHTLTFTCWQQHNATYTQTSSETWQYLDLVFVVSHKVPAKEEGWGVGKVERRVKRLAALPGCLRSQAWRKLRETEPWWSAGRACAHRVLMTDRGWQTLTSFCRLRETSTAEWNRRSPDITISQALLV